MKGKGSELVRPRSLTNRTRNADYPAFRLSGCKMELHTPVVSLASTKGGVGKTTLTFILASAFSRRISDGAEYRVACIDADPRRMLETIIRKSGNPNILSLAADAETLLEALREGQRRSRLVLIDLQGSANQTMLYAAGKSDLVIIPAQPSAFDVNEARTSAAVVSQAADLVGRDIALKVILTRTPVLKQRITQHSKVQFENAGLSVLPVELVHRNAFQSMTYTGREPFADDPSSGAAENVEAITDAVASLLGLAAWAEVLA
jgi:chromosome partitioning protein